VSDLGFVHRFEPGKSKRTLLLLHGTGGNENDLLPLGQAIDPDAALLSPRGKILEHGASRFFRRLAEGVFDEEDVVRRSRELGIFVRAASDTYGIELSQLVAVGYSNGANIAAAMILLGIDVLPRAILFRPMVPLSELKWAPDLKDLQTLLAAGQRDPIARLPIVEALAELLRHYGANVAIHRSLAGHELTSEDVTAARDWLAEKSAVQENGL
jgi:phospholipase/carboxylesterase